MADRLERAAHWASISQAIPWGWIGAGALLIWGTAAGLLKWLVGGDPLALIVAAAVIVLCLAGAVRLIAGLFITTSLPLDYPNTSTAAAASLPNPQPPASPGSSQAADALPALGYNELRHPNAPKGPGTMLWRWSGGDIIGPFCPIHKDPLLYRFVGTTGPFDDESYLGSGGAFYCPTDNHEVFRYNIENHGAKVKNLREEVRQRFKGADRARG